MTPRGSVGTHRTDCALNRDRHLAGVPYEGTEGAEAGEWFDRVGKLKAEIGERVADLRRARMALWNDSHADPPVYALGEMAWYRHPAERSAALRPDLWVDTECVVGREKAAIDFGRARGSIEHTRR